MTRTRTHAPSPGFTDVAVARYGRREVLRGLTAAGVVGLLTGQAGPGHAAAPKTDGSALDFESIDPGLRVGTTVAAGYRVQTLLRWGDPVLADAPAFDPRRQTAAGQARQFGYNCDFVAFMPLPRGSGASDHGLLCVNHEYTLAALMWPGRQRRAWSRERAAAEMAAHGHSVVEVRKERGRWRAIPGGVYNRRLTATTEMRIAGPAAGDRRLATRADPSGRLVQGTLNDCAGGTTPWGTVLIAEENFRYYFGGDPSATAEARNHAEMGIRCQPRYRWHQFFDRFDVAVEPHEPNRFGWTVELDPYDPDRVPVKRTALGRFQREGCTTAPARDGRLAVYSGDDHPFGFVFRFLSRDRVAAGDRGANRDLLDYGRLAAARFEPDGTVRWLPLVFGRGPLTPENGFATPADVLIEARRAARLLGATPMDRPEDVETNPRTGRVYVMLTNNSRRRPTKADAANPRAPNTYGHILELTPPAAGGTADHGADTYRWELYFLAGDPADPKHGATRAPGPAPRAWLAAPDNCAFDPKGRLWVATDRGSLQIETGIADGVYAFDPAGPAAAPPRMLFACPVGAEASGPAFTPDGRTLFVAVQHPGAGTSFESPSTRWPDFDPEIPPRPSVVAITREDGGPVGG